MLLVVKSIGIIFFFYIIIGIICKGSEELLRCGNIILLIWCFF